MTRASALITLSLALAAPAVAQNPRERKVRDDKVKVEADGYWIYNDLPKAVAEATASGKPLVVVLRCIPCEECVKLDDDLVNQDPVIRPLLDRFVRVRVVSANGLDLSLFQYDYDQSFAVMLLNADGAVYGRFGTRSHRTNWVGDVSLDGLAKALQGALDLHADYPRNKTELVAKRGPAPDYAVPEKYPSLAGKYGPSLDYVGNVVRSCIHCHQVGDAIRDLSRKAGPMPDEVLFPYPHPKAVGLTLDPKERATVVAVEPGTPAAAAGIKAGDQLRSLAGQPILSIADVQWVLHRTPAGGGTVAAEVVRDGRADERTLDLGPGWRRADDVSWRSGAWGLRRMATGGMLLESLPMDGRPAGVPPTGMALRVKHVGEFGAHAAAKKAGFRTGDVIVAFDGEKNLTRETDVFVHALTRHKPGATVQVTVVRGGKSETLTLPMQE